MPYNEIAINHLEVPVWETLTPEQKLGVLREVVADLVLEQASIEEELDFQMRLRHKLEQRVSRSIDMCNQVS